MPRTLMNLLLAVMLTPASSLAQDISIDDFAFLTGYWTGTGMDGRVEEIWMPPVDGRMLGIFKLSNGDGLQFSEYMEIVAEHGEFVLRLKHFSPDFTSWETPDGRVTFRLESVAPDQALFQGLTYRLTDSDSLEVVITLVYDDGRTVPEKLTFTRQPLGSR